MKDIPLFGKDRVKKLPGDSSKKKDPGIGYPSVSADEQGLIHQLQIMHLEREQKHEQLFKAPFSPDEINRKQPGLSDFTAVGYFALTIDVRIEEVNITGANILGINKDQLTDHVFSDFIVPEDQETFRACLCHLVETNESQIVKITLIRNDRHRVYVRIAVSGTWIGDDFHVLLAMTNISQWKLLEETQAFLLDDNGSVSGKGFFQSLADHLAKSLQMDYVSIDRIIQDQDEAEMISFYYEAALPPRSEYHLADFPVTLLPGQKSFCYPNGVHNLFPNNKLFQHLPAESFAGVILRGSNGNPIGLITIAGRKPLMDPGLTEMVLNQVSIRAAAELEHLQQEEAIIESQKKHELQLKERTAELQAINEQLRDEIRISQEKEASLKMAAEKYRTIADFTYNWETWLSPSGEYMYVSPSCKRVSGYSVNEFMLDPALLLKIIHPEDRHLAEEQFFNALHGDRTPYSFEYRILTRDGSERWIGHHFQPVFDSMGNFMGQRGSSHDITQRKVAERILIDSQKHLRQLSQRMDAITEAERTRIAREIHDELGHLLTALKFDMEAIINRPDDFESELKTELGTMMDMVDSLIDSVRKIATELRPGILDHLGLFPAIEWQLKQFRLRTKICYSISMNDMEISFDKNETTIIFRILQEILTNIARHAAATHVKVLLNKSDSDFMMEVTDNGVGFEYDDIPQINTLGLTGMKERALSIGGELQINSKPGKGTVVRLLLTRKNDVGQGAGKE